MKNLKYIDPIIIFSKLIFALLIVALCGCKKETNEAPWVTIISPLYSINVDSGDSLLIIAEAGDEDGYVTRVEFYINDQFIHQDDAPPYQYQYNSIPYGDHTVEVKAIDNNNLASEGKSIGVDGNFGNLIDIEFEFDPPQPSAGKETIIYVSAASPGCEIEKIELFIKGNSVTSVYDSTLQYSWIPVSAGQYSVLALATDTKQRTSRTGDTRVRVYDYEPPEISIQRDYGTWDITVPGYDLQVELEAESSHYNIDLLKLYLNDEVVATAENSGSLTYIYEDVPAGTFTYYGVAFDELGDSTVSNAFTQQIHQYVPVSDRIIDLVASAQPDKVFALSSTNNKLIILNPLTQSISEEVILPENSPTAFEYATSEQKLFFVSYFSGNVTVWDENTGNFELIFFSETADGRSIHVDGQNRRIYVGSSQGMFIIELDTHEVLLSGAYYGSYTYFAIQSDDQFLFSTEYSYLNKYDISTDQLIELQSVHTHATSSRKIFVTLDQTIVSVVSYGNLLQYSTENIETSMGEYDVKDWGFSNSNSGTMAYSGEYDYINYESKLNVFDSNTFEVIKEYPIPNANSQMKITTNANDSFIIAFTYNANYNEDYVIYFIEQ